MSGRLTGPLLPHEKEVIKSHFDQYVISANNPTGVQTKDEAICWFRMTFQRPEHEIVAAADGE